MLLSILRDSGSSPYSMKSLLRLAEGLGVSLSGFPPEYTVTIIGAGRHREISVATGRLLRRISATNFGFRASLQTSG